MPPPGFGRPPMGPPNAYNHQGMPPQHRMTPQQMQMHMQQQRQQQYFMRMQHHPQHQADSNIPYGAPHSIPMNQGAHTMAPQPNRIEIDKIFAQS